MNIRTSSLKALSYLPLAAAFVLSLLLLSPLGSGPAGSGAKVNLGPFQPIEAIRILLALFLAGYFARHWELLRAVRSDHIGSLNVPAWLNLPRARYAAPGRRRRRRRAGACSSGRRSRARADACGGVSRGLRGRPRHDRHGARGAVLLAAGFYVGYQLNISATLADRVRMWQRAVGQRRARRRSDRAGALGAWRPARRSAPGRPWRHALPAGGPYRSGPRVHRRRTRIRRARRDRSRLRGDGGPRAEHGAPASSDYGFFLALTLALFLVVPVLLMMSGTLGLVPLTGVVTPFLSFGGSAMVGNFAALGLLASIRSDTAPRADLSAFTIPVRWLSGGLALGGRASARHRRRWAEVRRADESSRNRIWDCKPTGCAAFNTIRGFSMSSGAFRAAPSSIEMVWRWPPTIREAARSAAPDYAKVGVSVEAACNDSQRKVLSARRTCLSSARRRPNTAKLGRVEHVVCRTRQRVSAEGLRRSPDARQRVGARRHTNNRSAPRLSRSRHCL